MRDFSSRFCGWNSSPPLSPWNSFRFLFLDSCGTSMSLFCNISWISFQNSWKSFLSIVSLCCLPFLASEKLRGLVPAGLWRICQSMSILFVRALNQRNYWILTYHLIHSALLIFSTNLCNPLLCFQKVQPKHLYFVRWNLMLHPWLSIWLGRMCGFQLLLFDLL